MAKYRITWGRIYTLAIFIFSGVTLFLLVRHIWHASRAALKLTTFIYGQNIPGGKVEEDEDWTLLEAIQSRVGSQCQAQQRESVVVRTLLLKTHSFGYMLHRWFVSSLYSQWSAIKLYASHATYKSATKSASYQPASFVQHMATFMKPLTTFRNFNCIPLERTSLYNVAFCTYGCAGTSSYMPCALLHMAKLDEGWLYTHLSIRC